MKRRWLLALVVFGAVISAPASLLFHTETASAAFVGVDIASGGPLTHIYIGQNMSCQVAHVGDVKFEMYSPTNQQGDCGTFVLVGGKVYGNGSFGSDFEFTFVSQTAVTGTGTSLDPYQVVTVGDAGATGVRVTETDQYVVGNEFYRTDVQVTNNGNSQTAIKVYRGADCYLGGSDSGFGFRDPVGKVVACTKNVNNLPPAFIEEWTPITPADHAYESTCCNEVEAKVSAGMDLPDTCDCATSEDNGAALQWNRTLTAGGGTSTVSHFTTFSPLGVGAPTPTPSGQSTEVPPSETPTVQLKLKTHTPTLTPTAAATSTPTPAPATNTPAATNTMVAPGGGRAGAIVGPNTGSGPDQGSGTSPFVYFAGAALLVAGGGVATTAIRRKQQRH